MSLIVYLKFFEIVEIEIYIVKIENKKTLWINLEK